MNILQLINYLGRGGTEKYITSLAEELHGESCNFLIAYSEDGGGLSFFKDNHIKSYRIKMRSFYDLKAAKELANFCKENSVDVIHTHFLRENYIAILSKLYGNKCKVINTRHMLSENNTFIKSLNRIMSKFNSSIIAVSKSVEKLLYRELGKNKNIVLIYNGISFENTDNRSSFREEFDIDDNVIIISTIARFSQEKGYKFLIESIYELVNDKDFIYKDKIKFVLAGNGKLLEDSKELVKNLKLEDYIIFTGYREDVENILNSTDIYVSPSEYEAFGLSLIEAMAKKIPVISTKSGGPEEFINDNTGILIEYGDKNNFVKNLNALLKDKNLREYYGVNGFKLAKSKFDIKISAKKTLNLYK